MYRGKGEPPGRTEKKILGAIVPNASLLEKNEKEKKDRVENNERQLTGRGEAGGKGEYFYFSRSRWTDICATRYTGRHSPLIPPN